MSPPINPQQGAGTTGFSWTETLRDHSNVVLEDGLRTWLVAVGLLLLGGVCVELLPTRRVGIVDPSLLTVGSVAITTFAFAICVRRPDAASRPLGIAFWAGLITVAAALRFSLGSLHPDFATEASHTMNIVLMVGFALLMPVPIRHGIPVIATIGLSYPLVQLMFGSATIGDARFATQVVDLSAGVGISTLVLVVHTRLLHGRSAALNDLAQLAEHDALTAVKNRRTFMARLVSECNRCQRYGLPMGVMMYDIDGFKRFNTEHGYAAGDVMLRAVAAALDGVMRLPRFAPLGGVVARYGGEEFVALLPAATPDLVERFANESRAAVAAKRVNFGGATLHVTMSVGYVTVDGGESVRRGALLDAADKALYRAKSTGGNRSLPAQQDASLAADLTNPGLRSTTGSTPNPKGRAEALHADNRLLHAVVLRWSLGIAALWILLIGLMDIAFAIDGTSEIHLGVALGVRFTLASSLGFLAWRRPRVIWSNVQPTLLHAFFIIGLSMLIVGAMERSGGLTSPYFGQLIYLILGWALAFSVPRIISVTVLIAVTSLMPIWYICIHSASLLHIDLVTRTVALTGAAIVAYATQRAFSRTRAEEVSARHELEELARVDPLTGLPNRAAFEERAAALVGRASLGIPLTLVILDLDHFKRLNDTYGHLLGDEALATVAEVITNTVRTADVPVRLGGEEFAVLLPMTEMDGAMLTAERLRTAIKATTLRREVKLAASFGISSWREGDTATAMLSRADAALRRAKAEGRDRIVTEAAA